MAGGPVPPLGGEERRAGATATESQSASSLHVSACKLEPPVAVWRSREPTQQTHKILTKMTRLGSKGGVENFQM